MHIDGPKHHTLAAIIVAGGRGRRFGSPLKCLPLLPRLVRALRAAGCQEIVIAGDHDGLAATGCRLARDAASGCGPLAGIVGGLAAVEGCTATVIAAGDLRRIRAQDVRRLIGAWHRHGCAVVAVARRHALFGLLPAADADLARRHLEARRLGVHRLWRAARARYVRFTPDRLRDRDHPAGPSQRGARS